jgi:Pectinacetylesterase
MFSKILAVGLVTVAGVTGCSSSQGSSPPVADAGGADAGEADAGADGGGGDAGTRPDSGDAAPNTTPISVPQGDTWTWVPFDNAFCRDGTTTGIAVNVHPGSTKLMIYLEGGGACFNALTCLQNAKHFDQNDFAAATGDGGAYADPPGIFGRSDPANPVKDWNFVYVPYCTGDVHAGDNPNGTVASVLETDGGLTPQRFVGYRNIGHYLERIVPTFPDVSQVLLTGISAGGFGAAANYLRVAKAFGSVPVYLLDDSGPPMDAPHVAPCESSAWVQTWSLDKTLLADCGSDCANDGHYLIGYVKHALAAYPNVPFGLVESTGDGTITQFFGFGAADCTSFVQETADDFTAGLVDIRAQLAGNANFGAYIFSGTRHTTLEFTANFDSQTVPGPDGGTAALTDWIRDLLGGHVTNVGP